MPQHVHQLLHGGIVDEEAELVQLLLHAAEHLLLELFGAREDLVHGQLRHQHPGLTLDQPFSPSPCRARGSYRTSATARSTSRVVGASLRRWAGLDVPLMAQSVFDTLGPGLLEKMDDLVC